MRKTSDAAADPRSGVSPVLRDYDIVRGRVALGGPAGEVQCDGSVRNGPSRDNISLALRRWLYHFGRRYRTSDNEPGSRRWISHNRALREPHLSDMAGIISTDFGSDTLGERLQHKRDEACLPTNGDRTLILHDVDIGRRDRSSSMEVETLRSISTLANFIAPISGAEATFHAKSLIRRFGSLANALEGHADSRDLSGKEAQALRLLHAARDLIELAMCEGMSNRTFSVGSPNFLRFVKLQLATCSNERVLAIFTDAGGQYLGSEIVAEGRTNQVVIPSRHIMRRALDLGAHGLVLAHNHPSGAATPSEQDVSVTERLREALMSCEVYLADHLIVSRSEVYSMRRGVIL